MGDHKMSEQSERAQYLAAAVLVHLNQQSGGTFFVSSILGHFKNQPDSFDEVENLSSLEEMRRIFKTLEELEYVYGYHDPYSEPRYQITDKGSMKVAEELNNRDSLVHRYDKFGKSWLAEVLEGISSSDSSSRQGANLHVKRALKSRKISGKSEFPSFREFRDALIVALYEKSNEEGLIVYKLKELADERNIHYRDGWIDEVSNFLNGHGYALVRKSMRGDENPVAKMNGSGLEYAEELIAEAESEENAPDGEPLFEIAGSSDTVPDGDGVPIIAVPASDRIVSRTDNQGAWDEATKTLDAVIAEYKKDHPRDNEIGSEKNALLGALIAGRKLFDNTRINVEVGVALLIEPLKLIVRRYEKELIGGLAATAFAAIAKLFGIL